MPADEDLLNMIIRHQMYLEKYKEHEMQRYTKSLNTIAREIRKVFSNIEKTQMRELTQREMRHVLRTIAASQQSIYNKYTGDLEKTLKDFAKADRNLLLDMHARVKPVPRRLRPTYSDLWEEIEDETLAATGENLLPFLAALGLTSIDAVTKHLRRSFADNRVIQEAINELIGTQERNYRDGLFRRIYNWQRSTVSTAMQHVASIANKVTSEKLYDRYRWVSLLDSNTCQICEERHGQTYVYGEGPQTPAHPHCQCDTVPVIESINIDRVIGSFGSWFKEQPEEFRSDVEENETLSLAGFLSKKRLILGN